MSSIVIDPSNVFGQAGTTGDLVEDRVTTVDWFVCGPIKGGNKGVIETKQGVVIYQIRK